VVSEHPLEDAEVVPIVDDERRQKSTAEAGLDDGRDVVALGRVPGRLDVVGDRSDGTMAEPGKVIILHYPGGTLNRLTIF